MEWTQILRTSLEGLLSICTLTAAVDLVTEDDGRSLGFRSVCGAAIALSALRALRELLQF